MNKLDPHQFAGMQQDIRSYEINSKYLYEGRNVRLTSQGDGSLLHVTNEKGNTQKMSITGCYLGHAVINNFLIVFTKEVKQTVKGTTTGKDYIWKIDLNIIDTTNDITKVITKLYGGNLEFSLDHPIETVTSYETKDIQKVYWTDGLNQPRVINITKDYQNENYTNENPFNFIPVLKLKEEVSISSSFSSEGYFHSGVIQYAISYYDRYGHESNLAYISPIHYINKKESGASADEYVGIVFKLDINNIDTNFEYIRIYSIHRTSLNSIPTTKIVKDIKINNEDSSISLYDDGNIGSTVDPSILLYKGGEEISAETMTSKDGTLFFGNIKLKRPVISKDIKDKLRVKKSSSSDVLEITDNKITYNLQVSSKEHVFTVNNNTDFYNDYLYDNSEYNARFKVGEYYRLGVQFQYKNGKWSDPVFITDVLISDDIVNKPTVKIDGDKYITTQPTIQLTLDKYISEIKELGYKNVRPVVVFPSIEDRRILVQGIVCPTMYNVGQRKTNSPYVQSSWFLRPYNSYIAYSHNSSVIYGTSEKAEIMGPHTVKASRSQTGKQFSLTRSYEDIEDYLYMIDQSIFNIFSPNIEFSTDLNNVLLSDTSFRICGVVNIDSVYGDMKVRTSSSPFFNDGGFKQFVKKSIGSKISPLSGSFSFEDNVLWENEEGTIKAFAQFVLWNARYPNNKEPYYPVAKWLLYPWHRSGPLNNDYNRPSTKGAPTSVLKEKVISNLYFSRSNNLNYTVDYSNKIYEVPMGSGSNAWMRKVPIELTEAKIVDSDDIAITKVKWNSESDEDINYYQNIDQIVTYNDNYHLPYSVTFKDVGNIKDGTYYYDTSHYQIDEYGDEVDGKDKTPGKYNKNFENFRDPIRIKYKTAPHIVLGFKPQIVKSETWTDYYQYVIPSFGYTWNDPKTRIDAYSKKPFWLADTSDNTSYYILNDIIYSPWEHVSSVSKDISDSYLFLGELYHKDLPKNLFNGTDDIALESNVWFPAGPAVEIEGKNSVVLDYIYGDTWYQRYDCLKTQPFTTEDENQIVEVVSFLCENRVNLDGRYDSNKGKVSFLNTTKQNFNLWNSVYSQKDNFFPHRILNEDLYNLNDFPTTIVWSQEKQPSSEVDPWTNINMSSSASLRGECGKINYLGVSGNNLYCFQDSGVSKIDFNTRVQIPASDGVPIEITNNYKYSGYNYVIEGIGTLNKHSIVETPNALYFIDANTSSIYQISEGIKNLTTTCNMSDYIHKKDLKTSWVPYEIKSSNKLKPEFKAFKGCYDSKNYRVYFINNEDSICFSEKLGQFESFVDYDNTFSIFSVNGKVYSLYYEIQNLQEPESEYGNRYNSLCTSLWENHTKPNTNIYGYDQDYSITFISNNDATLDKTYDTIEMRADVFKCTDGISKLSDDEPLLPFKTVRVWNEYQDTGEVSLENKKNKPSNFKQKFRTWRLQIPRDSKNKRDRIRNHWAFIKLTGETSENQRMELSDLGVRYFAQ